MQTKIINLTKKLIAIESTKDNPQALKQILALALKQVKGFTVEHFNKNNCPSALVYNTITRPRQFKIILNGHLDVVPGKEGQFKALLNKERIYGRGTDDMKAAAAVLILVFKELAAQLKYPIALQLVTDEEIGGFAGVKYQISQGVKSEFFITGETTQFNIKNEAKGVILFKISIKGTTAHGAYPWKGENALWKAQLILNKIQKKYPVPKKEVWQTTINLANIKTDNTSFNKVPDQAEIWCDCRYIASDKKTIISKLKSLVPKDCQIEFLENEPVHFTGKNNAYLIKLQQVAKSVLGKRPAIIKGHGASDARHFSELGMAGVEFGPVGQGLHSDNEWVNLESLEKYYSILSQYLLKL